MAAKSVYRRMISRSAKSNKSSELLGKLVTEALEDDELTRAMSSSSLCSISTEEEPEAIQAKPKRRVRFLIDEEVFVYEGADVSCHPDLYLSKKELKEIRKRTHVEGKLVSAENPLLVKSMEKLLDKCKKSKHDSEGSEVLAEWSALGFRGLKKFVSPKFSEEAKVANQRLLQHQKYLWKNPSRNNAESLRKQYQRCNSRFVMFAIKQGTEDFMDAQSM